VSVRPRHVGPSEGAGRVAARWEELVARAAGAPPRFERTFRTRIVPLGDEWLSLTELSDDFHEMHVALRVTRDGTVVEAVGRMDRRPYDTCPRAVEALAGLVGLDVFSPGASAAASERLPRAEGCLHLADMVRVALRAFRIARGHEVEHVGEEGRRALLELLAPLRDTCVSFAVEP
jgi:hypothetical protein